jgi:ribulose-phosphate 3-epimerase
MLDHPQQYVQAFQQAGADWITVHVEAEGLRTEAVLRRTLEEIRGGGARPGLSVRPRTTAAAVKPFLPSVELVLVMSVEPGFGGQVFMPEAVPKVRQLRSWFAGHIAVDGGINAETGRLMREAGADVLVAGTYIFRSASYAQAIRALREP